MTRSLLTVTSFPNHVLLFFSALGPAWGLLGHRCLVAPVASVSVAAWKSRQALHMAESFMEYH